MLRSVVALVGVCTGMALIDETPAVIPEAIASVELPAELDRVLRDYEKAWIAKDAKALAALFAADGFVLQHGRVPVHGRPAIEAAYVGQGGALALRAFAFAVEGDVAYVIGGYAEKVGVADSGKFTLTLRKGANGRFEIVSDMDNSNRARG